MAPTQAAQQWLVIAGNNGTMACDLCRARAKVWNGRSPNHKPTKRKRLYESERAGEALGGAATDGAKITFSTSSAAVSSDPKRTSSAGTRSRGRFSVLRMCATLKHTNV
eukprot:4297896-Pleurochrysis_carterae.AAC.2